MSENERAWRGAEEEKNLKEKNLKQTQHCGLAYVKV